MRKSISLFMASLCFMTLLASCGAQIPTKNSTQSSEEDFVCVIPDPLVIEVANGMLVFSTIASTPDAWYTKELVRERTGLQEKDRLKNTDNELLHAFFDVFNGKSAVVDYTNTLLTDFVYFTVNDVYEDEKFYCFAFNPTHGVFTVTNHNELIGTVILSENDTATIINAINSAK